MSKKDHSLNPAQEQAVQTSRGRLLVLAGAGSGKTKVIIHRIYHIITNLNEDPESILGLTFTNKAADEMRSRLSLLLGPKLAKKVTLCTFHSFCMKVLRAHIQHLGYTQAFSLYDEKDRLRLITHLAKDLLSHESDLPSLTPTIAAITKVKNEENTILDLDPLTKEIYSELEHAMRSYNAVDFDSLIPLCLKLFKEHPQILSLYQEKFRFIMIDEYQDTNPVQFALAEALCHKYQNLCVVGDDDQSIYGWRGAEVKNILNFKADKIVKLEQNYRSSPNILNAANAVISNNKDRHPKTLFSENPIEAPIKVFHAPNDEDEAESIVQKILHLRKTKHLKWKQFAVLYRSNILSRNIEMALIKATWQKDKEWIRGVPYKIIGGLEFSQRSEIKDIFAYLRLIANPSDTEALLRIINVPRRGISSQTLDILTTYQRTNKLSLWPLLSNLPTDQLKITPKGQKGIQEFISIIESARHRFAEKPLYKSLEWLLEKIDYKKAITDEAKTEKMRQFKWENTQECINALAQYEENIENKNELSLQHFISNSLLNNDASPIRKESMDEDKVHLLTLHSAKGLEFEACFIMGLEDHILPHEKSLLETGVEEERRLFYVGITRAKRYLTLSMARQRRSMGQLKNTSPSRFLFEIPKELYEITNYKESE